MSRRAEPIVHLTREPAGPFGGTWCRRRTRAGAEGGRVCVRCQALAQAARQADARRISAASRREALEPQVMALACPRCPARKGQRCRFLWDGPRGGEIRATFRGASGPWHRAREQGVAKIARAKQMGLIR